MVFVIIIYFMNDFSVLLYLIVFFLEKNKINYYNFILCYIKFLRKKLQSTNKI